MRQSINRVNIIGYLSETNLEEKEKDGKKYIAGSLVIRVPATADYSDRDITVQVFSYELTKKDNSISKVYTALKSIKENGKSIAVLGSSTYADKLSITGNLVEGFIPPKNEKAPVYFTKIRGGFIGPAKSNDNCKADFETEIMIKNICDEIIDDIPTNRLIVEGVVCQYGEVPDVIKYVVEKPDAINFIKSFWTPGSTVKVAGDINWYSVEKEVESSDNFAFGEPQKKVYNRSVKEYIIKTGTDVYLDGAFDSTEVTRALAAKRTKESSVEKTPTNSRGF